MHGRAGPRDQTIDALRGVAVALMVAAHTTDFIATNNGIWGTLRDIGNALCYSMFLFAFGAAAYWSLLAKPAGAAASRGALRRAWRLYLAYALMGAWAVWMASGASDPPRYLRMLAFIEVPAYTEFMASFVTVMLGLVGLKRLAPGAMEPAWLGRLPWVLAAGAALFFAGVTIFYASAEADPGQAGAAALTLLAGRTNHLRFPLLQYAPALLLGLWAGAALVAPDREEPAARLKIQLGWLSLALLALYLLLTLNSAGGAAMLTDAKQRWPPSLLYAVRGLAGTTGLFWGLRLLARTRLLGPLAALGRQALPILIFHICALRLVPKLGMERISGTLPLLMWYLGLLLGGVALNWLIGQARRRVQPAASAA